jgi:hypothetical protein
MTPSDETIPGRVVGIEQKETTMPDKTCRPSIAELQAILDNPDSGPVELAPDGSLRLPDFRRELESLLNRHSRENGCNTPDFILAEYLYCCLTAFDRAVIRREQWYAPQDAAILPPIQPATGLPTP